MDDVRDLKTENHRPLRVAVDDFRGDQLLGDDNHPLAGLHLFFVVPARAVNPGIAFLVRHLHLNDGDVGYQARIISSASSDTGSSVY